jgi:signal transduction histidine kinase
MVPNQFSTATASISLMLDNAGKYSDPGTPIKVTAEVKSDRLVISVADRGIGID